jgi:IS5 family transposase
MPCPSVECIARASKRPPYGLPRPCLNKRLAACRTKNGRYAHARQMKRARKEQKQLRTYLGRVIRDIERKLPEIAKRILTQQRHDRGKVYSMHAPEVECIGKGKAHKPYVFGVKVGIVSTNKESFVVGM